MLQATVSKYKTAVVQGDDALGRRSAGNFLTTIQGETSKRTCQAHLIEEFMSRVAVICKGRGAHKKEVVM